MTTRVTIVRNDMSAHPVNVKSIDPATGRVESTTELPLNNGSTIDLCIWTGQSVLIEEPVETTGETPEEPAEEPIDWRERYMREVEGLNNEGDPIGGEPPMGLRHQLMTGLSINAELIQRMQSADLAIKSLVLKAGGTVTLSKSDSHEAASYFLGFQEADGGESFTFSLVQAPAPADGSTVNVAEHGSVQ